MMIVDSKRQSGVALIVGLLMLLLLTIIMISAVQVTALEERMAGNLQNYNIAFQAAESALREAEDFILLRNELNDWDGDDARDVSSPFINVENGPFGIPDPAPDHLCVAGICRALVSECEFPMLTQSLQSAVFPDVDGEIVDGVNLGLKIASTGIDTIYEEPKYIIELVCSALDKEKPKGEALFRITAGARGGDSNSYVQLQTTLRVKIKVRKEWLVI